MTFLPQPIPPGPVAGAPGHFAHTDWLEDAIRALDDVVTQKSIVLSQGTATAQTVATGATFVPIRCEVTLAKSPGCPAFTITGNNLLTLGDLWPVGLYRVDWSVGWVAPAPAYATSTRSSQLLINGVVPVAGASPINMVASADSGRPAAVPGMCIAYLKPLDTLQIQGRHANGTNLDTQPSAIYLTTQFLTPATALVNA